MSKKATQDRQLTIDEMFEKLRAELTESYKPGEVGKAAKDTARTTFAALRKQVSAEHGSLIEQCDRLKAELAERDEELRLCKKRAGIPTSLRLAETIRHLGIPYQHVKEAEREARAAKPELWKGMFVNGGSN